MDERDDDLEVDEASERVLEAVRPHLGETLGTIVNEAPKLGFKPYEVARGIYAMETQGRLSVADPNPPSGFVGYLLSLYSLSYWLLLVFMAFQAYVIWWMPQVYPLTYLRIIVAVVFLLYIPGYTLIEALYPKAKELGRLERLGLSVGLSLALVPLVGLMLNYTPWGIRLESSLIGLSLLTAMLGLVAVYRKYGYWCLARGAWFG
ncbi:MAG: DUF1616 domain-containing protein [Candidatus Bathyarchaeia archaeon]|jgi:hypothetical protein